MMQILRSTPATLELKVYSAGDLIDLDADPSLTVTDANGDTVTTGAVTKPALTTGTYQATLDGQDDLKTLKAVWAGALSGDAVTFTQHYEIVGNRLFTEADARGARFTGQQAPLSDETTFPDDVVARMRSQIAGAFEQKTGRSWIRRYCRVELTGSGTRTLSLQNGIPRDVDGNTVGGQGRSRDIARIISASVGGVAVDLDILKLDRHRLIRTSGTWARTTDPFNVVIEYEYGDDPVDLEARENGLRMVVANLVPSDVPDYAQTLSVGGESTSFQQARTLHGLLRVWPERTREWLERNPSMAVA